VAGPARVGGACRNECQRLLALGAGGVGRVGLVEPEGVLVLPVNYGMLDEDIVI
jgi:hypothetical protein